MNGASLENFVIAELLKKRMYKDLGYGLYFYRDSNKNEIDMVIDHGYRQDLCEIKLSKTITQKHYKQLLTQGVHFTDPNHYLISGYSEDIKLTKDVRNIPVWKCGSVADTG